MRFRVLGPLTVEWPGGRRVARGRREQVLLGALLAHRNEVVPATRLAGFVWGPDGEPSRNALQARVSHLRRSFGLDAQRLAFAADGYRLVVLPGEADDDVLADALGRTQALLAQARGGAALDVLDSVLPTVEGEPYAPVGDHPAVVAAAARCRELVWAARELAARASLEAGEAGAALARATELIAEQPARQEARAILMRALDAQGRRAEALASYEEGRRLLEDAAGLEPAPLLRATYAEILQAERAQTHVASAGPGVLEPPEMIRWLGENGHLDAALQLAVRCAWGWWLAGERGRGRRLIEELLDRATGLPGMARPATRAARLWADALACHERDEATALADADAAAAGSAGADTRPHCPLSETETLALVLLADRRTERGEHAAAARLLGPALAALQANGNTWGLALGALVTARGHLLRGEPGRAEELAQDALAVFHDPPDPAGQLAALDLLGQAAEQRGAWAQARELHQRALLLAMHGGWPYAQCVQLMRLGNVTALAGEPAQGQQRLAEAVAVARRLQSPSLLALVANNLGLADARCGDRESAARRHRSALEWYRAAGSLSGIAMTTAALARVGPAAEAPALLTASWEAALATRDPRALAYTAESRALLADTTSRGAYHLGLAEALRARTGHPRAAGEQPAVDALAARIAAAGHLRADVEAGGRAGRQLAEELAAQLPAVQAAGSTTETSA
ncbi:MAG: BTAD domain-containing putative transcriptional regulator [Pseudonocardia sp.]